MATRKITRKVVESRTYKIYSLINGQATLLDTRDIKGRVKEYELKKEFGVDNVATELVKENYVTYSMSIDDFMKYAEKENN